MYFVYMDCVGYNIFGVQSLLLIICMGGNVVMLGVVCDC
jgi:hypothetical protein